MFLENKETINIVLRYVYCLCRTSTFYTHLQIIITFCRMCKFRVNFQPTSKAKNSTDSLRHIRSKIKLFSKFFLPITLYASEMPSKCNHCATNSIAKWVTVMLGPTEKRSITYIIQCRGHDSSRHHIRLRDHADDLLNLK